MTATIGFTGGAGSTASININGSPVLTLDASGNLDGVASINGGALSGFRNKIINGWMVIDQRNAGAAKNIILSYPNFTLDRWSVVSSSAVSGTLTTQRVAGDTTSQYAMRIAKTAGTYSGVLQAIQIIESANCYELSGKTVTLSFRARVGSSFTGTTTPFRALWTGTGVDQGGAGGIGAWTGAASATPTNISNPTLTTSFQTYIYNFTVPSGTTEIAIFLGRTTDASAGSANDYIDITDVQLEEGSVATPFETRAVGQEELLCRRYAQSSFPSGTAWAQNAGAGGSLNWIAAVTNQVWRITVPFNVPMRTTPTIITFYNPAAADANWSSASAAGTAVNSSSSGFSATQSGSPTIGAGSASTIHWSAVAEL